ncbi:TPA: host-nuclease inhibitor Gam family protein, partial [Shigella flexneri]
MSVKLRLPQSAYPIFDRIEEMAWARHYQQIVREEKETELADDL